VALRGWQLNGVLTMRTGYPFSPSIQTINWSRADSLGSDIRHYSRQCGGVTYPRK
jgi:hypothetical protein